MPHATLHHLLLLIDGGSEASYRAAAQAIALARLAGARLTAMAVIDTNTLRDLLTYRILASQEMIDLDRELEQSTRGHLERVRLLAREEGLVCEPVLVRGPYHTSVLDQRQQLGADLVVLATFHSSRVGRDLLARETQKIIDSCPCPVLLVK